MRKSRFTDEQMVSILREADRDTTATAAKRHGVSEQTITTWRKRFGAFEADDVRRQTAARSRERAAEETGGRARPRNRGDEGDRRKKTVSVQDRRAAVTYAMGRGGSQRRASPLIGVARSALGTRSRKAEKDAPVRGRMVELSARYPRYGYRRIAVFLGRDGHAMSFERAYRLWRQARLQVPRKRPRKRIAAGRPRPTAPTGANQVWSTDFVFDWYANGQKLKCLTVTDEWTREGLAIEVDGRMRSSRVIEVLSRLVCERGAPLYLRSDNGPEFVSRALLAWIVDQGIETALIDRAKPWQNDSGESFNGKFRDECLSLEWFRSRAEAKVMIETWRRHTNEVRPHSSLGYQTPASFAARIRTEHPAAATGRTAAVCGASAARPVVQPPRKGQIETASGVASSS